MWNPTVGRLLLVTLTLCLGTPAAADAEPAATFEWSMPSRFGAALDELGRVVETEPYEVRQGPWTVLLGVTGPACAEGATHRWSIGDHELKARPLGSCRYAVRFRREGARTVRLDARAGDARLRGSKKVVVRDWLIVSIGDSVASGEAVPDLPHPRRATWQSVRCHRSARAGPALAAKTIEDDDSHSSVTFVHLACSGATVPVGLLGPYAGVEPPNEPALEPQVSVLNRIDAARRVDAVLLSVGANDAHFGDVVRFCAKPARDCFKRILPRKQGGDGERTVGEIVKAALGDLPGRYRRLATAISPRIQPGQVYAVEYFDPTRDARGKTCKRILGSVSALELEHARSRVLEPLNERLATATVDHDWKLVDGVADLFRDHGYCAGAQAWVTTLRRSAEGLGGTLKGRFLGTLHPNRAGHEATATLIAAALERDLYPRRDFPERALPAPRADEAAGGGGGPNLPGGIAAALIVLGFAIGALFLLNPGGKATLAAMPFATLAKTARPLLLPLLVALAVATSEYSSVIQLLASAALAVIGWKLIVVPEAEKSAETSAEKSGGSSDEKTRWGGRLLKIGLQALAVVGIGALLLGIGKVVGIAEPYFDAIGDFPSVLFLLALLLWAFAALLRLISFATTPLRLAIAALIGLVAFLLVSEAGLLPGGGLFGDDWQDHARNLALIALGLLGLDAIVGAVRGEEQKPPPRRRRGMWRTAAIAGLDTAAVAAAVLAVSALWGMVEASERKRPLNPPDPQVAEIRPAAPGVTSLEGDLSLARRYAPVLVLHEDERWAPTSVDAYVERATLSGPPGIRKDGWTVSTLPDTCPEFGETACYELSIGCDGGGGRAAVVELCEGKAREKARLYREGAVYVRVLEKGKWKPEEPRGTFIDSGPYRKDLQTLIQYWYFYPYNEWRTPVVAGELVQRHEADWEAVTIGLDSYRRPLFLADSAHCGGSWVAWGKIEASTRLPGPRTHPLVAVAKGSHANYQNAGEKRAPDWASCAKGPEGVTTAISYASNIRDQTGYGWLWYPPADGWLRATPKQAPMSFPGHWGADDRTILRNFKTNVLHKGKAPKTPSLQGLWREPVRSIFCGGYEPRRCERDERRPDGPAGRGA